MSSPCLLLQRWRNPRHAPEGHAWTQSSHMYCQRSLCNQRTVFGRQTASCYCALKTKQLSDEAAINSRLLSQRDIYIYIFSFSHAQTPTLERFHFKTFSSDVTPALHVLMYMVMKSCFLVITWYTTIWLLSASPGLMFTAVTSVFHFLNVFRLCSSAVLRLVCLSIGGIIM